MCQYSEQILLTNSVRNVEVQPYEIHVFILRLERLTSRIRQLYIIVQCFSNLVTKETNQFVVKEFVNTKQ